MGYPVGMHDRFVDGVDSKDWKAGLQNDQRLQSTGRWLATLSMINLKSPDLVPSIETKPLSSHLRRPVGRISQHSKLSSVGSKLILTRRSESQS